MKKWEYSRDSYLPDLPIQNLSIDEIILKVRKQTRDKFHQRQVYRLDHLNLPKPRLLNELRRWKRVKFIGHNHKKSGSKFSSRFVHHNELWSQSTWDEQKEIIMRDGKHATRQSSQVFEYTLEVFRLCKNKGQKG